MKFSSGVAKIIRRGCGCGNAYLSKFTAEFSFPRQQRYLPCQRSVESCSPKAEYFTSSSMAAAPNSFNVSTDDTILIAIPEVKSFITKCLTSVGAKLSHAEAMAEVLIAADHRGHFSHGLNRLEMYVRDLQTKLCESDKEPEILKETVSTALVEGNNLLGAVVGNFCMDLAIEKAKNTGIGWVVARGSNHFGIAGWYSMRALKHGMIAVLGTNPLSVAAPAKDGDSYVLDMATSAVALGKIEVQARKGQQMPSGWALDSDGEVTTDPNEALKSWLLLPLGGEEANSGYKGYGLAMMVELFCGLLSGSSFGHHIRKWNKPDGPANLGQCFVALNPGAFSTGFEDRLSDLMTHCRNLTPTDPSKPILIPGDPENNNILLVNKNGGIKYHKNVIKVYDDLAAKLNVEPMKRI